MGDIFLGEDESKKYLRAVKRKRIRRLLDGDDRPDEGRKRFRRDISKASICKVERCSIRVFVTCLLLSLAAVILLGEFYAKSRQLDGLIASFKNNYQQHYHEIVHGRHNYCWDKLDSISLSDNIRKEQTIMHQNQALLELQWTLDIADRSQTFIAIIGPVGVGKTLYVDALQNHFPWSENVHSFVWNRYMRSKREKYRALNTLIEHFNECGVNLLIIKNLKPADKHVIDIVTNMIPRSKNLRTIVIFVFNLNSMVDEAEYLAQYNSLQNLNHTRTIIFRSFGRKELEDCIRRESKLENVTLSDSTFEELLDTIDVKRSGCKNVNAKVLAFGRKMTTGCRH